MFRLLPIRMCFTACIHANIHVQFSSALSLSLPLSLSLSPSPSPSLSLSLSLSPSLSLSLSLCLPDPCGNDPCRDIAQSASSICDRKGTGLYSNDYQCHCQMTYDWNQGTKQCERKGDSYPTLGLMYIYFVFEDRYVRNVQLRGDCTGVWRLYRCMDTV